MDKKALEAFARQTTKSIKTKSNLGYDKTHLNPDLTLEMGIIQNHSSPMMALFP